MGLPSGVGLVVANMVGAGVFISTGFMTRDLGPGLILLAWAVGAGIALAGTRAYMEVAALVPLSGGEYRYLSSLLHPFLGYLAGWASLLVGFSAPLAIDAIAAGAFLEVLGLAGDPRHSAAVIVVVLVGLHAFHLGLSRRSQDVFVALKVVLVAGSTALGLALGSWEWPRWSPPEAAPGGTLGAFLTSLFFIAFAFSGWNAPGYVAEEFDSPRETAPRAMLVGCAGVAVLYVALNWVFVANLTPSEAAVVVSYESSRMTLGHAVALRLAGETGAKIVSGLLFVALVSAASAMTVVGPRVTASMARDGFLPRALAGESGAPPAGSVLLQGALAIFLIYVQTVSAVLQNVGAVLTLFSAMTVAGLFRVWLRPEGRPRPRPASLVGAGIHVLFAVWMLAYGFRSSTHLAAWVGAIVLAAVVAYRFTGPPALRRRGTARPGASGP